MNSLESTISPSLPSCWLSNRPGSVTWLKLAHLAEEGDFNYGVTTRSFSRDKLCVQTHNDPLLWTPERLGVEMEERDVSQHPNSIV